MIPGARTVGVLLFAAAMSAPFQCGSKARPEHRFEDEPADALYKLAGRFAAKGDREARVETLRFIVERYPTSRFAEAARIDLTEMGAAPGASAAPPR